MALPELACFRALDRRDQFTAIYEAFYDVASDPALTSPACFRAADQRDQLTDLYAAIRAIEIGPDPPDPPVLAAFQDDFNRADGPLGANWDPVSGAAAIFSNTMRLSTGGFVENLMIFTEPCTTVNQYGKFIRVDDASFPSIPFRWTDAASPYYTLDFTNSDVAWNRHASLGGAVTNIQTVPFPTNAGSIVGTLLHGTGNDTVFRVWLAPPSNTPTSPTDWGGNTTPGAVLDANPAAPVNTGFRTGLGGFQGVANTERFDSYFGGDVPT